MNLTPTSRQDVKHLLQKFGAALALIIFALAFVLPGPPAACAASERHRVRVGYFVLPGLQDLSPNGKRSGYAYEYIRAVAALANWELEFHDGSFLECLTALTAGEIDLLGGVQYTEERGGKVLFPDIQAGMSYSTLLVRRGSSISFENFYAFNSMTVGILQGNSNEAAFREYRRANRFNTGIRHYNTDKELMEALRLGEVDAVLAPSARYASQEREVARFGPRPFYFVVNRNRRDVLGELNDAQNRLLVSDPMFQSRLVSRYLALRRPNQQIVFSSAEQYYLSTRPVLRVAYDANSRPVEYTDPKTGENAGISAAIFQHISKHSGLEFEFIPSPSYTRSLHMLTNGEVDMISDFILEYDTAAAMSMRATRPYLSLPLSQLVNRRGNPKTSVVPDGYLSDFWISRLTVGTEIIRAENPTRAFAEVNSGRAGSTFISSYVAEALLRETENPDLEVIGVPGYTKDMSIGLGPDLPQELLSVLNKSIDSLSGPELDSILFETLVEAKGLTLISFIKRNPYTAMLLLCGAVGLIITSLLVILWYRGRSAGKMRDLLYRDQLTGHWSIHRFRQEAEAALRNNPETTYTVVHLDINSLKYINDIYGYEAGDLTLKNVSEHLIKNLRRGEMTARIMADHFAVFLRGREGQIHSHLQYLLHELRNLEQIQQFQISTSAGAYVRCKGDLDISSMLDRANYARSVSKRGPADTVVMYDESIREAVRSETDIESNRLGALRRGEFEPFFQPKVDMLTGRMVGAEALVRWIHPEKGLIPPQQFIPLFEKNGFIVELDFYVYEQVCSLIQRWLPRYPNFKPISCNFSRLHIRNHQFQTSLETIAALYNVPAHILELEITESVAMENIDTLVALMFKLQKSGFRITIDDFGAGYSSLGLLQKLPANSLKLDKKFMEDIIDHRDRVIVKGIVDIAQKLNMEVVCEGIETFDQSEFLLSVNCRIAQGYYYARPMRAHDFELFMEQDPA